MLQSRACTTVAFDIIAIISHLLLLLQSLLLLLVKLPAIVPLQLLRLSLLLIPTTNNNHSSNRIIAVRIILIMIVVTIVITITNFLMIVMMVITLMPCQGQDTFGQAVCSSDQEQSHCYVPQISCSARTVLCNNLVNWVIYWGCIGIMEKKTKNTCNELHRAYGFLARPQV